MSEYENTLQVANDYIRMTGLTRTDLARRIGYSVTTFSIYMSGKYREVTKADRTNGKGSSEHLISAALLQYIEQHPIRVDEFIGHMYELGNLRTMRQVFATLARKPQIVMVYAPPGSGKTDLAKSLITDCNRQQDGVRFVRVYCSSRITPCDLIFNLCVECGSMGSPRIQQSLKNLKHDFHNRRVAIYFDEAQHLSPDCFEIVRELYDELGWSLCFAGSHQLDRVFLQFQGTLEQLERRVTDRIYLPSITSEEASGVIRSELPRLDSAQILGMIKGATVQIRQQKHIQRYISIGRIMSAIRVIQESCPENADDIDIAKEVR